MKFDHVLAQKQYLFHFIFKEMRRPCHLKEIKLNFCTSEEHAAVIRKVESF
jgi:hypothetical protein